MSLRYKLIKSDFYTYLPVLNSHALSWSPDQQVQPDCDLEPSPVESYLSAVRTWIVFPPLVGIIIQVLHNQICRHTDMSNPVIGERGPAIPPTLVEVVVSHPTSP